MPSGSSQPSKSEPSATCSRPDPRRRCSRRGARCPSRCGPANSSWKQTPTTPPESRTASSWRSVRLRSCGVSAAAHAWVTTSGRSAIAATSQKLRSLRCERSTRMPSSSHARTSARPASVRPPSEVDAVGERVRPAPRGPSERSPSACSAGSSSRPGSIASAPSMCMTASDGAAELEVAGRARHAHRSRPLEREQLADARERVADGEVVLDGRLRLAVGRIAAGVRREDREEAAREPAGAGAREVEVALVRRVGERALAEQHVVVSVEDRDGHRDTVTWCSTSPVRSAARWRCSASAGPS